MTLRDVVEKFEKGKELQRIATEVDPVLEISEVCDRVVKKGGPALLFEKPKGYTLPLLINLFGSEQRMSRILNVDSLPQLAEKMKEWMSRVTDPPQGGFFDKLKALPKLYDLATGVPKTVSNGPCKEIILKGEQASFDALPILQCWPQDAGKFITLPLIFTRDPETGKRNAGVYRMQIFDSRTSGMHWQRHKDGALHWKKAGEKKQRVEVAIALGAPPAATFCGCAPMPPGFDEMLLAGLLQGKGMEMIRAETVDVDVPAESEIVLEGYVNNDELRTEGPFGDHTGFYSLEDPFPIFHLTGLTMRRHSIYQTIIVGRPPMEDDYLGLAVEYLMRPLIQMQLPEVVDIHMPFEGIFHNLLLVSMKKRYPGQARKVMHAFWGLGQAMFSKMIIVLDHDVNLRNYREVVWKTLNFIDPRRDMEFVTGPKDDLDFASPQSAYGTKVGIDATKKWKEEGFERPWPDPIEMSPEVKRRIDTLWSQLGL